MNAKEIFSSYLFWDTEEVDTEKHKEYVIARVLNFGSDEDITRLREIYSDEDIKQALKKRRDILKKTAYFWALYFDIPLEELRCLKK